MKKVGLILFIFVIIGGGLIACGNQDINDNPNNDVENIQEEDNTVVDPSSQGENKKVKLYYVNKEYIVTGDESLQKMIPIEKEITIKEKSLEETILEELKKSPQDEKLSTSLQNIEVLSVEVAENTAYVNLSGNKLFGGSLEEMTILQQIVFSLTELDQIDQVQILVDGSKRETLMGHMMIEDPLTRNDLE